MQSYDLQKELRNVKEQSRKNRQQALEEVENKLSETQELLKEQVDLNEDLKNKVSKVLLKDVEQVQLIDESSEQIKAM